MATFYRAKCGNHASSGVSFVPDDGSVRLSAGDQDDEDEEMTAAAVDLPDTLSEVPVENLRCNCFDENCKIRKYFRYHTRLRESRTAAGHPPVAENDSSRFHAGASQPLLRRAHRDLLREAGGIEAAETAYQCCLGIARKDPDVVLGSDARGNTYLHKLCCRSPRDRKARETLHAQIAAFARIYLEQDRRESVFARNANGVSALDLAAVSDLRAVAVYLSALYHCVGGRDPNETNSEGHSVLHLMARKGDDCADTLEALLALRAAPGGRGGPRLFKIDVVNEGRKTPLDVAAACAEMFSTGPGRAVYARVIAAFHAVVEEDATEMIMT